METAAWRMHRQPEFCRRKALLRQNEAVYLDCCCLCMLWARRRRNGSILFPFASQFARLLIRRRSAHFVWIINFKLTFALGGVLLCIMRVIVFSFPSNVSLRLLLWFTLPQKHNCIFIHSTKKFFLPFKRRKKKKTLPWHRNRLHLSCWLGWNYKTAAFWHVSMSGFHCPTSENGEFLKKHQYGFNLRLDWLDNWLVTRR